MNSRQGGPGTGAGSRRGVQATPLQRRPSAGSHERQAEQRASAFVQGASGLGRGLSAAPAGAYRDPSSPSMPLPGPLLGRLQLAFDADLAAVRVHTDARAVAADFGARAFASGADLYFAPGDGPRARPAGRR